MGSEELGIGLSALGVVVSIGGFWIALRQIKKTKTAAEAAKTASRDAVAAVGRVETISDVAFSLASVKDIQSAIRGHQFETALIRTQIVREALVRLRARPAMRPRAKQQRVQIMLTNLSDIETELEEHLANPERGISQATLNRTLSEMNDDFSAWLEDARFQGKG